MPIWQTVENRERKKEEDEERVQTRAYRKIVHVIYLHFHREVE